MGRCDTIWKFTKQNNYKCPKSNGTTGCTSVKELPHCFKVFFTDRLFNEVIAETNDYVHAKLVNRQLLEHSICRTWEKCKYERILCIQSCNCRMLVANIQEQSKIIVEFSLFSFSNTFAISNLNQIFWMLELKTIPNRSTDIRNC